MNPRRIRAAQLHVKIFILEALQFQPDSVHWEPTPP
jgi:hypothetical protein